MTALWTAEEAAAATEGTTVASWEASGVSIDSRTVAAGDLFIALGGPFHDGHDFVKAALAQGAAAAMVSRVPEGVSPDRLLVVADTMAGLHALARRARERCAARVIAVTGSVGKTGTKEMLKLCLGRQARTHASEGNLNNHWGLPLSLARMPADTMYAVLEMGMNHAGELTPLSRLARPDVAVITTVDAVHMEFFDSTAAIADAKAEIFAGMGDRCVAVLNRDNPHFDRLARAALARGMTNIMGFGAHADSEFRLTDCAIDGNGTEVQAWIDDQPVHYRLGAAGRHWAINSLAVLAAVAAAGGKIRTAAEALADMAAPKGRGARHRVAVPGGTVDVIDESYNASPVSTAAAIATLAATPTGPGGRRVAALGDMLELGAQSGELHAGLAKPLLANDIDLVFTAGPHMLLLHDSLPSARRGGHADRSEDLAAMVAGAVRTGDVVMVKGSAGSRTGVIVRALLDLDRDGGGAGVANGNGN